MADVPLHPRSLPRRLLARAGVVALLFSPLLSLPVCLAGYYRSPDPCTWARAQAAERGHAPPVGLTTPAGCFERWLDGALAPRVAEHQPPPHPPMWTAAAPGM